MKEEEGGAAVEAQDPIIGDKPICNGDKEGGEGAHIRSLRPRRQVRNLNDDYDDDEEDSNQGSKRGGSRKRGRGRNKEKRTPGVCGNDSENNQVESGPPKRRKKQDDPLGETKTASRSSSRKKTIKQGDPPPKNPWIGKKRDENVSDFYCISLV